MTRAIYTQELFATNHDDAKRAEVARVAAEDLDLVGIDFRAERKTFSRVTVGRVMCGSSET